MTEQKSRGVVNGPDVRVGHLAGQTFVNSSFLLFVILTLIVVSQIAFAACVPANRTILAPAVVNDNRSEMVRVSIETRPGTGQVYASVSPPVGLETQTSEKTAADIAFDLVGKTECDIFVTITVEEGVTHVEGPSAGGALTVLMFSALSGNMTRTDFSMTGTIEPDGSIGAVGGIPLKAEAVSKQGYSLFLVPELTNYDKFGVLIVKRSYPLTVVEVSDIQSAIGIALSNETPEESLTLSSEKEQTYANATLDHWYAPQLETMASNMIDISKEKADVADPSFKENFESRAKNAENAIDAGQLYTSANIAFLLAIDEDLSNFSQQNLASTYFETKDCISTFKLKDLTDRNFEVIGPAQLRYVWASLRLPKEVPKNNGFVASMYEYYGDMLYSKYWCVAANDLNNYSYPGGERTFDGSVLREYAKGVLDQLSLDLAEIESNPDIDFHYLAASEAFDKKLYVASLVDAAFVRAYVDLLNTSPDDMGPLLRERLWQNYTHVWPQVMKNHAATLEAADKVSALRISDYAYRIDESFREASRLIEASLANKSAAGRKEQEAYAGVNGIESALLFIAIGAIVAIVVTLIIASKTGVTQKK